MKPRKAYTLIETLLAVSLLGVFLLIASRLVVANFRVTDTTLAANWSTARFDHAVTALRADVSAAKSVEMPQPTLLRINDGSRTIDWRIDNNTLSRQFEKDNQTWDVGQPLSLKLDGAVVILALSPFDQIAMAPLPAGGTK